MRFPDWISTSDYWIVWLILSISVLTLLVLCVILIHRIRFILFDLRFRKFQSVLNGLLSKVINRYDQKEKYLTKIKAIVNSRWKKDLLLDQLVVMCYNFSGIYAVRSREVFDHFQLRQDCLKKLKSSKWNKIVEGIIELSIMDEKDGYELIEPLLDHDNYQVRKQAKIAIVEIDKIEGLMKMESRIGIMSRWTFISILSILHRNPFKLSQSNLDLLKQSKNPSTRRLSEYLGKYSVLHP